MIETMVNNVAPPKAEEEELAKLFFQACCDEQAKNGWPSNAHGRWNEQSDVAERVRVCFRAGARAILLHLRDR